MDLHNNEDLDSARNTVRRMSIERCIQSLVHACQCHDEHCPSLPCHKMKRVVAHTKFCTRRIKGNCQICKQIIALCCFHSRHCSKELNECLVPFCLSVKQKLKNHKEHLQWRLKQLSSITPDQRRHATELLFETISSRTYYVVLGQIVMDKASYAEKAERELYSNKADSPTDYYRLLASLKWKIDMEYEERLMRAARELSEELQIQN